MPEPRPTKDPSATSPSSPLPTESGQPALSPTDGETERRRIAGRAGVVAAGTLSSRVLGLLRDQVIAASFSRATTDVFFVAFTIPNVLRQLLAEGAVQNAVLPVLEGVKTREGEASARRLFSHLRGWSWIILLGVSVLGVWAAPLLVELFASGYHQQGEQFTRTVLLTRWIFPYILFMGTAALGVAALNVHRRFVVSSFAPGLLNVAFVLAALALPTWLATRGEDPALALAFGALLGGLLQVLAQWPSLRGIGYFGKPSLSIRDPHVREVFRRMGPVLFGIGIYYIDVMLARRFLSELPLGSQSYFNWAMRLCDFPQGIFVMALQSATLPSLSKLVAQGRLDEVKRTFVYSMRLTLFVALGATTACLLLAEPLVVLLFQRGHFDAQSSRETARALVAQGTGIWMVAAVRQLVSVFFALGDTKTPVRVAAIDLGVFVVLALVLREPLGHVGVGWAVTGASLAQMAMLWAVLGRRLAGTGLADIVPAALRGLAAALTAGCLARLVATTVQPTGAAGALMRAVPGLAGAAVFGVSFLLLAWWFGCQELRVVPWFAKRHRGQS